MKNLKFKCKTYFKPPSRHTNKLERVIFSQNLIIAQYFNLKIICVNDNGCANKHAILTSLYLSKLLYNFFATNFFK